jgi:FixJ family two-component response regulator
MEAEILSHTMPPRWRSASKHQVHLGALWAGSPTQKNDVGALRSSLGASDDADWVAIRPAVTIIDDDESVRIATKSLLRSLGYAVYTFTSAEDYLRSPRVNDTSCLIADVQMPGMTGTELQRHLLSQGRRTPMIFITAYPEEKIRARVLEAGAVAFLSKPFDEQTLTACLDQALKGTEDDTAQT